MCGLCAAYVRLMLGGRVGTGSIPRVSASFAQEGQNLGRCALATGTPPKFHTAGLGEVSSQHSRPCVLWGVLCCLF